MTTAYPFPRRRLGSTSVEVTALGFGAAALGNLFRAIPDDTAQACLLAALDSGIAYIDTAPHYGQGLSERRIGQALGKSLASRPLLTLSTKVGRVLTPVAPSPAGTERHGFIDGDPFEPVFDYSHDGVMRSFESSQKRLEREKIDILLAHDLGIVTHGDDAAGHMEAFLDGGLRAMQDLKAQGLVGAIGLGVNEWQVCEEVLAHADLDVVLLAGRYTLLDRSAEKELLPLCRERGTSFIIGGVFNSGIMATGPVPGATFNYMEATDDVRFRVGKMQEIAEAAGTDLATVALQFRFEEPVVASVLLGTTKVSSLKRNLDSMQVELDPAIFGKFEEYAIR